MSLEAARKYLASIGAKGGKAKTAAKLRAAKRNLAKARRAPMTDARRAALRGNAAKARAALDAKRNQG
jgi:hypothetical protein